MRRAAAARMVVLAGEGRLLLFLFLAVGHQRATATALDGWSGGMGAGSGCFFGVFFKKIMDVIRRIKFMSSMEILGFRFRFIIEISVLV